MSKDITARELSEWFTERNLPVPAEVSQALENEKADNAFHVIEKKVVPTIKTKRTARVTEWQERLFALSTDLEKDFVFEITGQQGRGNSQVVRRQVSIETEQGTLLVKLHRPHVPDVPQTETK